MLGYDRKTFGAMIHEFKFYYGLRPNENSIFHDDGSVFDPKGGLIGNIHDFAR